MQQVRLNVGENKFADALLILSQLYDNPDLPAVPGAGGYADPGPDWPPR